MILFISICLFSLAVHAGEYVGYSSALAVREYIDSKISDDDVHAVVVEVDSACVDGIAIVTVTVFTNDTSNIPISVMLDFESLADSAVRIIDTTYFKEIKN